MLGKKTESEELAGGGYKQAGKSAFEYCNLDNGK